MEKFWTDDNFNTEVLGSSLPVVVDFYADWCGPCKMMTPALDALAKEYEGRVVIGKVNVDENPGLCGTYKIMSIPAICFFKNGQMVDQIIGAVPKQKVAEKIANML